MRALAVIRNRGDEAPLIADPSFRRILGELAWRRLAPAVRARFAVKPAPGAELRYVARCA
jgi:hypothetical protein